ncbi:MAG: hypothetical protein ACRCZ5_09600, partial [Burkholderiales bacterium]
RWSDEANERYVILAADGLPQVIAQREHCLNAGSCLCGPIISRFRANAAARFHKYITATTSVHHQAYAAMQARLDKVGPAAPFTLPPEAVLQAVIHALESRRPRARYRVTTPTRVFAVAKRLLSTRLLDKLLLLSVRDERQR